MTRSAVRLTDVARGAGVSPSTASRALNGDARISVKTRQRVEQVATRLAYRPDPIARGLTLGRTFTVGFVVGELSNPFYAELAQGVEEALEPAGYIYLLANCDEDADRQYELARRLLERKVDALLLTVPYHPDALAFSEVPVVAFDRADPRVPYVSVDNVMGGRIATEHLVAQGYRRIGILYGQPDAPPVRERLEGYRAALREAHFRTDRKLEMLCPALTFSAAREGALKLLAAGADAIFAINDVMAAAALAAGQELGRRIPRDLGIVGYDDTEMASWPPLSLTSVAQASVTQGREAGHLVLRLIEDPDAAVDSILLPPRLTVRNSSRRTTRRSAASS